LRIAERGQHIQIVEERLEDETPLPGNDLPQSYFHVSDGAGKLWPRLQNGNARDMRLLSPEELPFSQSLLRERRDIVLYPEATFAATLFGNIRLYREWNLGPRSKARAPQPTDLPNDFLEEDLANITLVLNRLKLGRGIEKIERYLNDLYENFERVEVSVYANTAQLWILEKGLTSPVPAQRLSDGALRFLALLTILCHPSPPPLVCIEEPELGLHPDVIPKITELLKEASERTQLIVTTHSSDLVDGLYNDPESVVICERGFDYETELKRLSAKRLKRWLERYELGELWRKGEIGGNRW
jgi:predicted ATPase